MKLIDAEKLQEEIKNFGFDRETEACLLDLVSFQPEIKGDQESTKTDRGSVMNKKASDLLLESAIPFDEACILVKGLEAENAELRAKLAEYQTLCKKLYEANKAQDQKEWVSVIDKLQAMKGE